MIVLAVLSCGQQHKQKERDSLIPTGPSPQPASSDRDTQNGKGGEYTHLPSVLSAQSSPLQMWPALSSFHIRLRELDSSEFIETVGELLRLRQEIGGRGTMKAWTVAAKIEDLITLEITRRLNRGDIALSECDDLLTSYARPVFERRALEMVLNYAPDPSPNRTTSIYSARNLMDFVYEGSGGEEKMFEEAAALSVETAEAWVLITKKDVFRLSAIINARRRLAALNAYIAYVERGGDRTARPMFAALQETVPDYLERPVVITSNLIDEPITTLEIVELADTE